MISDSVMSHESESCVREPIILISQSALIHYAPTLDCGTEGGRLRVQVGGDLETDTEHEWGTYRAPELSIGT